VEEVKMKVDRKTRNRANKALRALPLFHETPGLAYGAALDALAPEGLWAGLAWVPKSGTVRITLMTGRPDTPEEREVDGSLLILQTHQMPSGRTELTAYLS
jgi:hypothetical protein